MSSPRQDDENAFAEAVRSGSPQGRLDVPQRHRYRLGLLSSLGWGGIAVALMTASTLGIALMVPGFLSGAKPQAQRRVK